MIGSPLTYMTASPANAEKAIMHHEEMPTQAPKHPSHDGCISLHALTEVRYSLHRSNEPPLFDLKLLLPPPRLKRQRCPSILVGLRWLSDAIRVNCGRFHPGVTR